MKRAEAEGRRVEVVLREEDVGGYSVRYIEIPAAMSQWQTRSEALKNIRETIELYLEAFPDESKIVEELAMVTGRKGGVKVAGGKASTGKTAILDAQLTGIDRRVPTYLGDSQFFSQFEDLVKRNAKCGSEDAETAPRKPSSEVRVRT